MTTPRNIVGPQLRRWRIDNGTSQQALAERLQRKGWDVSRGLIARIEGQVRWVADFELLFLSKTLGKPVEWFLSDPQAGRLTTRLVRELQYSVE